MGIRRRSDVRLGNKRGEEMPGTMHVPCIPYIYIFYLSRDPVLNLRCGEDGDLYSMVRCEGPVVPNLRFGTTESLQVG